MCFEKGWTSRNLWFLLISMLHDALCCVAAAEAADWIAGHSHHEQESFDHRFQPSFHCDSAPTDTGLVKGLPG